MAFVANVSHELRTPLNLIISLVGLMVETPEIYAAILSPKMRKDLEIVHRNCMHLSNMINDVLDLTRMGAGRLTLHRERVSLEEIIARSVEAIRPLLENKPLSLQIHAPIATARASNRRPSTC
jgi:signal transduction histidine kinase